jgi:hypothetical protein
LWKKVRTGNGVRAAKNIARPHFTEQRVLQIRRRFILKVGAKPAKSTLGYKINLGPLETLNPADV